MARAVTDIAHGAVILWVGVLRMIGATSGQSRQVARFTCSATVCITTHAIGAEPADTMAVTAAWLGKSLLGLAGLVRCVAKMRIDAFGILLATG